MSRQTSGATMGQTICAVRPPSTVESALCFSGGSRCILPSGLAAEPSEISVFDAKSQPDLRGAASGPTLEERLVALEVEVGPSLAGRLARIEEAASFREHRVEQRLLSRIADLEVRLTEAIVAGADRSAGAGEVQLQVAGAKESDLEAAQALGECADAENEKRIVLHAPSDDDPEHVGARDEPCEEADSMTTRSGKAEPGTRFNGSLRTHGDDSAAVGATLFEEMAQAFGTSYPPQENILEVSVFAFTPALHSSTSFGLLAVLVLSFCLRAVFCAVALQVLPRMDLLPSVASVQKWRETVAHSADVMDKHAWVSLSDRVCSADPSLHTSTGQLGLVESIKAYTDVTLGIQQGPLLCVLSLVMWILSVVPEMRATLSFGIAIFHVSAGETEMEMSGDLIRCTSISLLRRIALCFVASLRVGIAIMLTCSGCFWLASTIRPEDMILRAAALSFVLDLDRALLATLASAQIRAMCAKVEPLPRPRPHWRGSDLWPLAVLCWLAVLLPMFSNVIFGHLEEVKAVEEQLCHGRTSFVAQVNTQTGTMFASATESVLSGRQERSFYQEAVQQLIWTEFSAHDNLALEMTQEGFVDHSEQSMEEMIMMQGSCRDLDLSGMQVPGNLYFALLHHTGVDISDRRTASCGRFAHLCDDEDQDLLRFSCPATCGCHEPLSGLLWKTTLSGCPMDSCATAAQSQVFEASPCEDFPPGVVLESPGWVRYWRSYNASRAVYGDAGVQPLVLGALALGCQGISGDPWAGTSRGVCSHETAASSSLRSFCPATCGCRERPSAECPGTCADRPAP